MSPNRRPYKTLDGHVCCLIYTDKHWALFLEAVGKSELLRTDARFKNIRTRTQAINRLYQLVADELPSAPRPSGRNAAAGGNPHLSHAQL
jgi:crotonobetainyl-CoA:carnitine CoA-transferase CaiB-like acyl-CoA transferase